MEIKILNIFVSLWNWLLRLFRKPGKQVTISQPNPIEFKLNIDAHEAMETIEKMKVALENFNKTAKKSANVLAQLKKSMPKNKRNARKNLLPEKKRRAK